eukprot:6670-Heterococcus_DN1.PRE.3
MAAETTSNESSNNVVGAAVRGGGLLMLLAFLQRASTFCLNILLQRSMMGSKDFAAYGAASIGLELMLSTILFISREPFRLALCRKGGLADQSKARDRSALVNVAWLSLPVGVCAAVCVYALQPYLLTLDPSLGKQAHQAVAAMCLAAALELACEPVALLFQVLRSHILQRVVIYGSMVVRAGLGVLAFGYAQLLHSCTLILFYALAVAQHLRTPKHVTATSTSTANTTAGAAVTAADAVSNKQQQQQVPQSSDTAPTAAPHKSDSSVSSVWLPSAVWSAAATEQKCSRLHQDVPLCGVDIVTVAVILRSTPILMCDHHYVSQMRLVGLLMVQSGFKHLLTEGDKIVLTRAQQGASSYQQGVYAVAHNYGSLVARLLFQPIEESARLMFARLGSSSSNSTSTNTSGSCSSDSTSASNSSARSKQQQYPLETGAANRSSDSMLRRQSHSATAHTAHGAQQQGYYQYCLYVPCLAVNGMCEAFVYALAGAGQLCSGTTRHPLDASWCDCGACEQQARHLIAASVQLLILLQSVSRNSLNNADSSITSEDSTHTKQQCSSSSSSSSVAMTFNQTRKSLFKHANVVSLLQHTAEVCNGTSVIEVAATDAKHTAIA